MSREVVKILEISRCTDKYRRCNCCGNEIRDKERRQNLVDDNIIHELCFGKDNQSTTIVLCNDCLNEFAEKLWEYL